MINTTDLLDNFAKLTTIRDLEMLELSLIKTLQSFLKPKGISMIKLDMKYVPRMEIVYGRTKCRVRFENLTVSETVKSAIEHMVRKNIREYILINGENQQTIYYIVETSSTRTFLLIQSNPVIKTIDPHMVTVLIQVYRNFCNLLLYSQTDILTGLANRKTFDECILKVYELPPPEVDDFRNERRKNEPMFYWLAMIDIDHFKSVNDKFGHLYGDQVLMLLAQTLRSVFREDDMIFRFGGEEFVVILRCQNKEGCKIALERLRKTVEMREFPEVGRITISIGAVKIERSIFPMTILGNADQALYHSKENGRNKITMFEDFTEPGIVSSKE